MWEKRSRWRELSRASTSLDLLSTSELFLLTSASLASTARSFASTSRDFSSTLLTNAFASISFESAVNLISAFSERSSLRAFSSCIGFKSVVNLIYSITNAVMRKWDFNQRKQLNEYWNYVLKKSTETWKLESYISCTLLLDPQSFPQPLFALLNICHRNHVRVTFTLKALVSLIKLILKLFKFGAPLLFLQQQKTHIVLVFKKLFKQINQTSKKIIWSNQVEEAVTVRIIPQ